MDISINGYDSDFRLYQERKFLSEADVLDLLCRVVQSAPWYPKYQRSEATGDLKWYESFVERDGDGLIFEHGDHRYKLILDAQVVILSDQQRESRARMRRKAEVVPQTEKETYLLHANQCGYLVKNTKLYFVRTKNQWSGSVKTRIKAELEELQSFVDASGCLILADLDTHIKNQEDRLQEFGEYIDGQHKAFAIAIVEFLNIEDIIDVEDIIHQFGQTIDDSGFQSIERWGGTADVVLDGLICSRPDINADDIREHFVAGCHKELL